MSKIEWCDPYERHKKCLYTWLLCWKRIRENRSIHEKQIGVKIAKLIPINFRNAQVGEFKLMYEEEKFFWQLKETDDNNVIVRYDQLKPCPTCFLPLKSVGILSDTGFVVARWICTQNHIFSYLEIYPRCCLGQHSCKDCAEKLAEKNNWILPENKNCE